MKVSYKILKKYLPYIESAKKVADDLIMHTAEVEEIHLEGENLKDVYIGKIINVEKHLSSDKLNICKVLIKGEKKQIICGASNVKVGLKVAVAIPGAKLTENFVVQKTQIRGEFSDGMICSLDEIGLEKERQKGIWEMPENAPLDISLREYLKKDDEILEIDNKAINHRPDMFSYMGIFREIATVNNKELDIKYKKIDFSKLPTLNAKNEIPNFVKRYSLLEISGVENKPSNEEITSIIQASGHSVKGLLVDLSNYSLYFYGQPTHIFDKDKVEGKIIIRFAKSGESFEALDDKVYELSENDIVIADEKKVLALGGVIGGKSSAVSETTKNIIIESACFDHATLRLTGKKLGIRTDALNIFEKDIVPELASYATALIVRELEKEFPKLKMVSYFDSYVKKQEEIKQVFDLDFYNKLIGANYKEDYAINILKNLGIKKVGNELIIPFWRKELVYKADIAEEISRIDGFDKIDATIPKINLGAVVQSDIYNLKNDTKKYFSDKGFFEVYNYSFVSKELLEKLNMDIDNCIELKNSLSEEVTHMRNSLIPNLMKGLEENIKNKKDIKLFEIEKIFYQNKNEIGENYSLSGVMTIDKDIVYYDVQNIFSDFLESIFVSEFYFKKTNNFPEFAHKGRTASIIFRGKEIGHIGEIHPVISKRFDIDDKVGFFEINIEKLAGAVYQKSKIKELSNFQENNFDLSFVVPKDLEGREIYLTILNSDKKIINEVELFDIYENEEKIPQKRSLSFKVYIQSMTGTITDEEKGKLINDIILRVEKKGGVLRG